MGWLPEGAGPRGNLALPQVQGRWPLGGGRPSDLKDVLVQGVTVLWQNPAQKGLRDCLKGWHACLASARPRVQTSVSPKQNKTLLLQRWQLAAVSAGPRGQVAQERALLFFSSPGHPGPAAR
jgi:hypothetical protein